MDQNWAKCWTKIVGETTDFGLQSGKIANFATRHLHYYFQIGCTLAMTGVISCGHEWDHRRKVAQKTVGPGPPMYFCVFLLLILLHKRRFSSNSKILFSLVFFCIDKRHAAYTSHMILVLSHNKGKPNRILELLENLLLCNRISNKKTQKTWDPNRWTIKV